MVDEELIKRAPGSAQSSPRLSDMGLVEEIEYSGGDSPQTPQSAKFTQDEEFTDPDSPVTVIKTAIEIDQTTLQEEKERQKAAEEKRLEASSMKVGEESDEEERDLLRKYRGE